MYILINGGTVGIIKNITHIRTDLILCAVIY